MKSLLDIFKTTSPASQDQISARELQNLMETSKIKVIPLDVRSDVEYNRYHIRSALHIHIVDLSIESLEKALSLKDGEQVIVITYCNAGGRGGRSFSLLKSQNTNKNIQVKNLTHGINQWIEAGFPIEESL
ncbi:MAG: rhodanese-like domain-containing protein [Alphaproteobacteria bacterium]|jgi:rhodanese-related sulfurtransferase|nr:rhodanese-like domain-containing protein [Alphaproteobacteria bacterium]